VINKLLNASERQFVLVFWIALFWLFDQSFFSFTLMFQRDTEKIDVANIAEAKVHYVKISRESQ